MTKIGLIGYGCVGQGFHHIIKEKQLLVSIEKIGVKNKEKVRPKNYNYSFHPEEILQDPSIEIIVEAIDDPEAALLYAVKTLEQGKTYITANKKMVAENLPLLKETENKNGGSLLFEAAVCGSIPIIQLINNYYKNEKIISIEGILNGSTNYILSKMSTDELSYEEALYEAQVKGFAETDPTLDVQGYDAVNKLTILSYEAFGKYINPAAILRKGIEHVKLKDIKAASERGEKIKLIGTLFYEEDELKAFVRPTTINSDHPLYNVDYENNALVIEGEFAGKQILYGKGAGSLPTGLAVVGDLLHVLTLTKTPVLV